MNLAKFFAGKIVLSFGVFTATATAGTYGVLILRNHSDIHYVEPTLQVETKKNIT